MCYIKKSVVLYKIIILFIHQMLLGWRLNFDVDVLDPLFHSFILCIATHFHQVLATVIAIVLS